jgi:hypothetical protein
MLSEGMKVRYKAMEGVINFLDKSCVTITVRKGEHKAQDVNIVVYRDQFNFIEVI